MCRAIRFLPRRPILCVWTHSRQAVKVSWQENAESKRPSETTGSTSKLSQLLMTRELERNAISECECDNCFSMPRGKTASVSCCSRLFQWSFSFLFGSRQMSQHDLQDRRASQTAPSARLKVNLTRRYGSVIISIAPPGLSG